MRSTRAAVASVLAAAVLSVLAASAAWADASALVAAAQANDHAKAVALLQQGAPVPARSVDGTTALEWAVHNDDVDLVKRLIKAGADVSAVNAYGASAMQQAALNADPAVIGLLLKAGADVDSPNSEGQTALMVVARTGKVAAAKVLLRHHAQVNAVEQWGGQTALMWAAANRQPAMVQLLIRHGATLDLHSVVRHWPRHVTAEGRPKIEGDGGFTALHYAAREDCIPCAQELVKAGADINATDPKGVTPLILALLNMHFDLAAYLIDAGADINRWDFFGRTPLYVAVDLDTVPAGGRPDLPSSDKHTGLDIAAMLLKRGADVNAQLKLRPPYRNGIFDRGGDMVLSTGATPLLLAAKIGDVAAVKLLLKYHPRVNLPTATGVTPLMAAAGVGQSFNPTRGRYKTDAEAAECVRLIYAAGGKVNSYNNRKLTALHAAAGLGWNQTIRTLVADGAALEPLDDHGLTPIDHAYGKQPRAFLEPAHVPHQATIKLLHGIIVAKTGRPPRVFPGTFNVQVTGVGGAAGSAGHGRVKSK